VIVAVGKPREIWLMEMRENALLIDCGVNRDEHGKICGDIAMTTSKRITPVPGGVGLLTRAMLMRHVERVRV
jgi:methylenetetrahydrofolate dehydrogenase (NADP+)/methenyltetrahydrofolate cyclohydrolase